MWRRQVDALQDDFHVLVPDLPGQGRSTGGRFTMLEAAERIGELIGKVAGGTAHVVGLSEGAQVLVQLLAMRSELVRTAIISSALVRPLPGGSLASSPLALALAYDTSVAPFRNSDTWIRLNMRSAAGIPDEYFDDFRHSFRNMSKEGFVDLMRANQTFRLPRQLDQVRSRVLAVCGQREYAAMRRSTVDIAAAIPGASAYEVVHSRRLSLAQEHNWNMNEPDLFNQMIRAFIGDRPLPDALVPLRAPRVPRDSG